VSPWRHRLGVALAVATAVAAAGSAVLSTVGVAAATAGASTPAPAFTQTQTVTRTTLASDGTTSVVASDTVTLSVSQTQDLEGRQEISVSWSGAHPTGGIVANQNSVDAQYEEYPMVLLECRGDGSGADPVSPQTCWTQSWTERFQRSNASQQYGLYPPYRLDQYSSTPGAVVGRPTPKTTLPQTPSCQNTAVKYGTPVQYWIPWVAASGHVYDGGTGGTCGQPPQADSGITSALPSNETFGVTGANGTGSAEFDVFTTTENTTLGCSATVACSLVAIPIMGISCDGDLFGSSPTKAELADLAACRSTGAYSPGQGANTQLYQNGDALSVSGSLWWSPSNWRNRVVVPLTFAPQPDACSLTGPNRALNAYGSELMIQATDQWDPGFCTDPADGFSLSQVPSPEPEARNLVASGAADAALTSFAQSGGYGKPVVNAPVAVTGFTISYAISLPTGGEVTTLKLTPLLLAKLLTQSYQGTRNYGDPALAGNPLNITDDPEFHALNPEIPENTTGLGPGIPESELISLSSNSDVIQALTTYIGDTPAARAFLDGTPDTSVPGEDMVVNPAYKGIQLPVDQWPLLSTYVSTAFDNSATIAPCLASSPQPLYTLIDAPMATLEDISEAMQFEKPNSTLTCSSNAEETVNSMVTAGRQQAGHYFMLGITPLADDDRYNLRAASLETTSGTFVAPSDTSLRAATALLQPDTATGTWTVPYDTFRTSTGSSAYPGTMVVYAAVPTSGLTTTVAHDYATFLDFAATTGQTTGSGVGQLPPGYLPMTAADGLAALAAYTEAAAADVEAQNGQVPALVPTSTSGTSSTSGTATATSPSATASSTASATAGATGTGGTSAFVAGFPQFGSLLSLPATLTAGLPVGATSTAHAARHAHAPVEGPTSIELSPTADEALWVGSLPVVLVLLLALLGVVVIPTLYRVGRRRGRW
jgi:hypothetical protein